MRAGVEAVEVILPDRLPSSSILCDLVFMVFFWGRDAARIRSVALHQKAEPPALLRGSSLQRAPREAGWCKLGEAVRATEREWRHRKRDLKMRASSKCRGRQTSNDSEPITPKVRNRLGWGDMSSDVCNKDGG